MKLFCALSSKTKILNRKIEIFCFVVVLQFRFCTIFNTNFCNSNKINSPTLVVLSYFFIYFNICKHSVRATLAAY